MSVLSTTEPTIVPLSASQIEDLKLASSKMSGAERRTFQAAMTWKYCRGNARQAERVLGWNRDTVELGLHEQRTGITCLGAQAACCGNRLWEEKYPVVAEALWALAESHCQQDPTFRGTLSYTRLTAAEAFQQLRAQGFPEDDLPSPSTIGGGSEPERLPPASGRQGQAPKKLPETDAIFANLAEKDGNPTTGATGVEEGQIMRLSID